MYLKSENVQYRITLDSKFSLRNSRIFCAFMQIIHCAYWKETGEIFLINTFKIFGPINCGGWEKCEVGNAASKRRGNVKIIRIDDSLLLKYLEAAHTNWFMFLMSASSWRMASRTIDGKKHYIWDFVHLI